MNHSWTIVKQGRSTLQVCERCGITRKKTSVKKLMAITPTPPYHYKYKSIWVYYIHDSKTNNRPDCIIQKQKQKKIFKQLTLLF